MFIEGKKRAQLAIFVIIAMVIVAGIGVYYFTKDKFSFGSVPAEFKPIYDQYENCIQEKTESAIDLIESQGGRIFLEDYIPGSSFAPFSSQLNFLGFPVQYWYYISGNGISQENVPTKSLMEEDIARFVGDELVNCNFDNFYAQGFYIELGEPKVSTNIQDNKVTVDVSSNVVVTKGEETAGKTSHVAEVSSKLGKFYNIAKGIYEKEMKDAFFEEYAIDVMRLYAPVDGVEMSCSPKVWKTREVVESIKDGLTANMAALKFQGDYYKLSDKEDEYFVIDYPVEESVNIIYSKSWPSKFEVYGADNELMIAKPVGNQEGMGIMGFCYAPYHFVYDMSFPVLMQIYSGQEIFQFPMVIVIDKNVPKEAEISEFLGESEEIENMCEFASQDIEVNLYDNELNAVDGSVSYICFTKQCDLGNTEGGRLIAKVPSCYNGYVKISSEGYGDKKELFSSNEESVIDMVMEKKYTLALDMEVGGSKLEGSAVVSFEGPRTTSAALPDTEEIELSEGLYNVSVYVYGASDIVFPETKKTQCQEVARTGLAGFFGGTREECYDITLPETKIDYALIGGGKSQLYLLKSDLQKGKLMVRADSLPKPTSLEQLQYNFDAVDSMGVDLVYG